MRQRMRTTSGQYAPTPVECGPFAASTAPFMLSTPDPRGVRSFGPDAGPQGRKRALNPQGSSQRVPDDVAVRSLEA